MPDARKGAVRTDLTAERWLTHLRALCDAPHYAVAVSGGPDSMALMGLAAQAQQTHGQRFTVLTVDHGVRPEARRETAMVRDQAKALNLPVKVLKCPDRLTASGLQEAAREARYQLMADYCHRHGIHALVTAHHLHDQAETVLMRLARGSDLAGLAGMSPVLGRDQLIIVRPFLAYPPDDLVMICRQMNLPSVQDPSNRDQRFERVRWREALPALTALGLSPDRLAQSASRLRRVYDDLTDMAHDHMQKWQAILPIGIIRLPRAEFIELSDTVRRRILTQSLVWLGRGAHPPRQSSLDAVMRRCLGQDPSGCTLAGVDIRIRRHDILMGRELAALKALAPQPVARRNYVVWDGRFSLHLSRTVAPFAVAPLGHLGLRQLKSAGFEADRSIPSRFYTTMPALFDGDQLVACPHLMPDHRAIAGLVTPFATKSLS